MFGISINKYGSIEPYLFIDTPNIIIIIDIMCIKCQTVLFDP